jgi:aromatic ring-opening dioxygenase catalytic subunit (LigB family)
MEEVRVFFMEWTLGPADSWDKMADWLRSIGKTLPGKPEAIVVISAHWEEPEFTVYKHRNPPLFYDYYGFPAHTYQLKYNPPGSPQLAENIEKLMTEAGIPVRSELTRGFDHGVFIPLKVMFPGADIPIVQFSLKKGLDPREHMRAGRVLAPLRNEGVLIIGSGNTYHNLQAMLSGRDNPESEIFDKWLTQAVSKDIDSRIQDLGDWEHAPAARLAHPREEHLIPLMVVSGAAEDSPGRRVFTDFVMGSRFSAYQFG